MQGDDAEVWTGLYHDVGQKNADKLRIEQAETLKNK